ncbi:MAG: cobyrinate a,c-diamide synthase [Muribaculaceae bacterium]|nr:cobyrinate a,c-diamide synthase [Muribaculaceae bacterium]
MKSAFLIAATSSGSGKTTLSLGLMKALCRQGLSVQPFKCGPDYIDTQYHREATGHDSVNLDLFMASAQHVHSLFNSYSASADVSIIEGVMGMFDGYDRMLGSSADIAHRLNIPVVLLINAASTAYSVAATIYGFTHFCKDVRVAGVIFNRVASESHYSYLRKACEDTGIEALGYISKNDSLHTPSRHLGLTLESQAEMNRFINIAADEVEKHVDIDRLLVRTRMTLSEKILPVIPVKRNLRVAVACDEAFSFIYPANIKALNSEIVYFSPLHDKILPKADMLYLPGGYPELYAEALEKNLSMRQSVREYAESGHRVLAECGGMIYLTKDIDGKEMCGILPLSTTMKNARLRLGYRKVCFGNMELRGHEFHYSQTENLANLPSVAVQFNVRDEEFKTPVYRYKNVIAGYTHLYWAETDIFKLWEQ